MGAVAKSRGKRPRVSPFSPDPRRPEPRAQQAILVEESEPRRGDSQSPRSEEARGSGNRTAATAPSRQDIILKQNPAAGRRERKRPRSVERLRQEFQEKVAAQQGDEHFETEEEKMESKIHYFEYKKTIHDTI